MTLHQEQHTRETEDEENRGIQQAQIRVHFLHELAQGSGYGTTWSHKPSGGVNLGREALYELLQDPNSLSSTRVSVPKAPWSAAAWRRLGITTEHGVAQRVGLTLSSSSHHNPRPAQYEGGVKPPHSKALRA